MQEEAPPPLLRPCQSPLVLKGMQHITFAVRPFPPPSFGKKVHTCQTYKKKIRVNINYIRREEISTDRLVRPLASAQHQHIILGAPKICTCV